MKQEKTEAHIEARHNISPANVSRYQKDVGEGIVVGSPMMTVIGQKKL